MSRQRVAPQLHDQLQELIEAEKAGFLTAGEYEDSKRVLLRSFISNTPENDDSSTVRTATWSTNTNLLAAAAAAASSYPGEFVENSAFFRGAADGENKPPSNHGWPLHPRPRSTRSSTGTHGESLAAQAHLASKAHDDVALGAPHHPTTDASKASPSREQQGATRATSRPTRRPTSSATGVSVRAAASRTTVLTGSPRSGSGSGGSSSSRRTAASRWRAALGKTRSVSAGTEPAGPSLPTAGGRSTNALRRPGVSSKAAGIAVVAVGRFSRSRSLPSGKNKPSTPRSARSPASKSVSGPAQRWSQPASTVSTAVGKTQPVSAKAAGLAVIAASRLQQAQTLPGRTITRIDDPSSDQGSPQNTHVNVKLQGARRIFPDLPPRNGALKSPAQIDPESRSQQEKGISKDILARALSSAKVALSESHVRRQRSPARRSSAPSLTPLGDHARRQKLAAAHDAAQLPQRRATVSSAAEGRRDSLQQSTALGPRAMFPASEAYENGGDVRDSGNEPPRSYLGAPATSPVATSIPRSSSSGFPNASEGSLSQQPVSRASSKPEATDSSEETRYQASKEAGSVLPLTPPPPRSPRRSETNNQSKERRPSYRIPDDYDLQGEWFGHYQAVPVPALEPRSPKGSGRRRVSFADPDKPNKKHPHRPDPYFDTLTTTSRRLIREAGN